MHETLKLDDYLRILRTRISYFAISAGVVILIALVAALAAAPVYRSQATILIEDLSVPDGFFGAAFSGFASQQIEVVGRRVLTNESIGKIIAKHDLYPGWPLESKTEIATVAREFRSNVALEPVSAEIIGPSRRASFATIAFNLGFLDSDPSVAKAIAEELATLFLAENTRLRTSAALNLWEFLRDEADAKSQELVEREAELARFKEANSGALPELYQYNISLAEDADDQLLSFTTRLQGLEKRRQTLVSRLALIDPSAGSAAGIDSEMLSDEDRLRRALNEYRDATARYSDVHPDVVRLDREISSLADTVTPVADDALLTELLNFERERLVRLTRVHGDSHPDISATRDSIERIEQRRATMAEDSPGLDSSASNPAYILVSSELTAVEREISGFQSQIQELRRKKERVDDLVRRGPQVEKEYVALLRAYETAQMEYQEVGQRQREAELALEAEQDTTGRRFTLIEPPILPARPVGPDRLATVVIGVLLGFALGIVVVTLVELLDRSVRGAEAVAEIVGASPLVSVPYIQNEFDVTATRRRRLLMIGGTLIAILIAMTLIGLAQ